MASKDELKAFLVMARALGLAAQEAYWDEIVQTSIVDELVRDGKEYYDQSDWLCSRVDDWLWLAIGCEVGDVW